MSIELQFCQEERGFDIGRSQLHTGCFFGSKYNLLYFVLLIVQLAC